MKRLMLVGCVATATWLTASCGGSSSETPFPQPPLDPGLERRHDEASRALHEEGAEEVAEPVSPKSATPGRPSTPNGAGDE